MRPVSAWAIVSPGGGPQAHLVRKRRAEAIDALCVGLGVSRSDGGWAHLYRRGWRCVRVTVVEAPRRDPLDRVDAQLRVLLDGALDDLKACERGTNAESYVGGQAQAFSVALTKVLEAKR